MKVGGRVQLHFDLARLSPAPDDPPPTKYADMPHEVSFSGEVTACEPPHRLARFWRRYTPVEAAYERQIAS